MSTNTIILNWILIVNTITVILKLILIECYYNNIIVNFNCEYYYNNIKLDFNCGAVNWFWIQTKNLSTAETYSLRCRTVNIILNCMLCWPCVSIRLCNKNQLDALFILSLFRKSTSTCFGHICGPSSGGILHVYIYIYIYIHTHTTIGTCCAAVI